MKNKTHRALNGNFWLLLIFLAAISAIVHAAPGDIDMTFAGVGKFKIGFGNGSDNGRASVIQPDGKIVVAGDTDNLSLVVRYNPNGTLDTTFAGDGIFLNPSSYGVEIYSIVLQPDGKLIVIGKAFYAARINPNGTIDTSFGNNGFITTFITGSNSDFAYSAAIQADGKIVLAGASNTLQNPQISLVRYNPNGTLDTSFDNDGIVTTSVGFGFNIARAVAVQPDGKIVAVSESGAGNFKVVRYLPNGSLDPSFDGDGIAADNNSGINRASSVVLQPDGKIIGAGSAGGRFAVVRYNPDGSLDTAFGQNGVASTTLVVSNNSAFLNSMALQPNGKIVVAGYGSFFSSSSKDFIVIRYNSNGTPDASFDGDGIATTHLGSINDEAYSVVLQPDEKIVVSGKTSASGNYDLAVVRYNSDGSLDATFGGGGVVITDGSAGSGWANAYGVAIHTDNKITVAGSSFDPMNVQHFTVLRFNESGSFDTSFGDGGKVVTRINARSSVAYALAVQPDGKTVAVGNSGNNSDRATFTVARYNVNGSLDASFDGDGIRTVEIEGQYHHRATCVVIQPDGKIVAGGEYRYDEGSFSAFLAVRLNADGSLDSTFDGDGIAINRIGSSNNNEVNSLVLDSEGNIVLGGQAYNLALLGLKPNGSINNTFGNNGVVSTPIGFFNSSTNSLAIQSDNKIVAGGTYLISFSGDTGSALTRYNFDGSLDTSFDGDGIVTSNFGTSEDSITSIRLQPDGKIIAGGYSYSQNGGNNFAVARYNSNGLLDAGWGNGGVVFTDFGGTIDEIRGIALDRFGRVVAVGRSNFLIGMARYKGDVEPIITATISGRVVTASGRGIPNARITLSNSQGEIRTVMTNPFGYYRFVGIPVGGGYSLNINSKQIYTFAPSTLTINLFEDYAQANFTGSMTAASLR